MPDRDSNEATRFVPINRTPDIIRPVHGRNYIHSTGSRAAGMPESRLPWDILFWFFRPASRRMFPKWIVIADAILCVFVFAFSSPSQTLQHSTSTVIVEGTVVDQNDAPVSGAEVIINAGSFTRSSKTESSGQFHFDSIPSAVIILRIAAAGF